jgi:hypothetical protein
MLQTSPAKHTAVAVFAVQCLHVTSDNQQRRLACLWQDSALLDGMEATVGHNMPNIGWRVSSIAVRGVDDCSTLRQQYHGGCCDWVVLQGMAQLRMCCPSVLTGMHVWQKESTAP